MENKINYSKISLAAFFNKRGWQLITAPLPNACRRISICKYCPFGKEVIFLCKCVVTLVSLFKHFGRQVFQNALGKAPKRYKQVVDDVPPKD